MSSYPPNPYSDTAPYNDGRGQSGSRYPEPKHSGLGIASFAMSLIAGFGLVVLLVVSVMMGAEDMPDDSPQLVFLGLGVIGIGMLEFAAAVFGFIGLLQANTKKLFSILGLVFSVGAGLMFFGLMVIGLMLEA